MEGNRGIEWTTCPLCKEEESYWWDHEGGFCNNGCFGQDCSACGEIPERGLYANGTFEIDNAMDVCPECLADFPKATITDTPNPAIGCILYWMLPDTR